MVGGTVEEFSRLDILVNNAADAHKEVEIADMDLDFWQKITDLNVTGTMLSAQAALKAILPCQSGGLLPAPSQDGED
ncbi:MAG: SDR family oxidoreductase, partial [Anaerolineae bacterium]|nr:SDR family oxidoreductase [Anaerolineae bacterium]